MLEFHIKNIENIKLLQSCYFINFLNLDINDDSINKIFSSLDINNILFEIFIYDFNNFKFDYMRNLLKNILDKNYIKGKNNIFNIIDF